MIAGPARGQLDKENVSSPVPVRAWEFGLARQVRSSRPASARLFSTLLSESDWLVLTHGDSSRLP